MSGRIRPRQGSVQVLSEPDRFSGLWFLSVGAEPSPLLRDLPVVLLPGSGSGGGAGLSGNQTKPNQTLALEIMLIKYKYSAYLQNITPYQQNKNAIS